MSDIQNSEDTLKENVTHKSLLTPILIMGGEREISLMVMLISVMLVIFIQTWIALILGISLWLISMPLLRVMAKKDTQMSTIYRKSLTYKTYYPAQSTPYVNIPNKRTSIKIKR